MVAVTQFPVYKEENDSCHLKVPEQLGKQETFQNKYPTLTARSRWVLGEDQPPSPCCASRVLWEGLQSAFQCAPRCCHWQEL